jgi:virginiamycin A acetyltransferase
MREAKIGTLIVRFYKRIPFKKRFLALATRFEGGQLYSVSLRDIMRAYYGVEIGNYSYGSLLAPGMADRQTSIGSYVSIGPNVRRFGAAHPMTQLSMHPFWYNSSLGLVSKGHDVHRSHCEIGHDSWIGANSTILPGCKRIGIGAVIGAGSVVTKDVPDFAIVVGNPAQQRGTRLTESQRELLLQYRPWELGPLEFKKVLARLEVTDR